VSGDVPRAFQNSWPILVLRCSSGKSKYLSYKFFLNRFLSKRVSTIKFLSSQGSAMVVS